MAPIAELTSAAAEIARTRDPSRRVPQPAADDEVAELSRTLEGMLRELDAARGETESMLARQRRFVADASHELRTPLTSVLANLELLAESLRGDEGDAARSALRSSQRMRRLVADLLLLARTDVGRVLERKPCDLAQIVVEAAGELGPVSGEHAISLEVHPAVVEGARDELHRLVINLLENALRHTPARHRDQRLDGHRRRRTGASSSSRTTAPASRPSSCRRCSSASCAAPETAAAPSGWASRSSRRSPIPRRHASTLEPIDDRPGATIVAERASSCACRPTQTSTTTGSTIGRRFRRS